MFLLIIYWEGLAMNAALADLIDLLATIAVDEYLAEIRIDESKKSSVGNTSIRAGPATPINVDSESNL